MTTNIESLVADLQSTNRLLRVKAIWAAKKLGELARPVIPALKSIMMDTSEPYFRIIAAGVIGQIDPDDPSPVPVLVEGLKDVESLHRVAAIEFLGDRRSKTAVLNAMPLLTDSDFLVRFAVGKALGKTFGEWLHAVSVCVQILKDNNASNRASGSECLLSIRRHAKDHLDLLEMAIKDCSWESRLDLEEILAELRRTEP